MATSPNTNPTQTPVMGSSVIPPSKVQRFSNLWTLHYRHGMNATLIKNFPCDGDLQVAKRRAQLHCQIMGYKFIWIRPLVCDIEAEEEYKLKGISPEEGY